MLKELDRDLIAGFVSARLTLHVSWREYAYELPWQLLDACLWEARRQQHAEMAAVYGKGIIKTPAVNKARKAYLEKYAEIRGIALARQGQDNVD